MIKKNFIDNFSSVEDVVGHMISKIRDKNHKVVLFGTGYCLSMFIDLMRDNHIDILVLCDNDSRKHNSYIQGYQVLSSEDILDLNEEFSIVIATSHFEEIEQQLLNQGCYKPILHLPKDAYYKNTVYDIEFIKKNKINFEKTFMNLEDDISKEVFINVICHNVSFDDKYFENIKNHETEGYFGTELFDNKAAEVIVDGGAYNGDTIREFLRDETRKVKEIIAYEPDKDNYQELTGISDSRITSINKGLGAKKETVKFSAGGGVSSNINEWGNYTIEIDAIDNLIPEREITFIKMDIEGAEEQALVGAARVIKRYKPTLAISAYHRKQDMFALVNLIKGLNPNYKIYFRHTFFYQTVRIQPDVIIYAI